MIKSFDKYTPQLVHRKYPHVRTSYLTDNNKKTFAEDLSELGFTPFICSPDYKMVDASLVKACHDKQVKINPWTISTTAEIDGRKSLVLTGLFPTIRICWCG